MSIFADVLTFELVGSHVVVDVDGGGGDGDVHGDDVRN